MLIISWNIDLDTPKCLNVSLHLNSLDYFEKEGIVMFLLSYCDVAGDVVDDDGDPFQDTETPLHQPLVVLH